MKHTIFPFPVKGTLLFAAVLLTSCSARLTQFYSDRYYYEDKVYENKPIGFLLTFRGNWLIFTDPSEMNRHYRDFAETMQRAGGELLFMGSTVEGLYGVKAIALNLNEPPREYAGYIRNLNRRELQNDREPVDFLAGSNAMVKWIYDKSDYRFVEFFFVVDTYDVRLSFWTKPQLFDNFLVIFESIAASLTLTSGIE